MTTSYSGCVTDGGTSTRVSDQERCRNCGRFCGVVYRHRGPSYSEVQSCVYCGINPPRCTYEDGSVYGCKSDATHVQDGANLDLYWCEDHAPEEADQLPYVEGDSSDE